MRWWMVMVFGVLACSGATSSSPEPSPSLAPEPSPSPSSSLVPEPSPSPSLPPGSCLRCGPPNEVGRVVDTALDEISGLAVSRRNAGVLWVHNDSGGGPSLYALDFGGHTLRRFEVDGAAARDWEALALGPCPQDAAADCLYVGDVGDNSNNRNDAEVLVIVEPLVDAGEVSPVAGTLGIQHRLPFEWPGGAVDCEALSVDAAGVVRLVSKTTSVPSVVARFPSPLTPGEKVTLEVERRLEEPGSAVLVTGADMHHRAPLLLFRGYFRHWQLSLDNGELCDLGASPEGQGETLAWLAGEGAAGSFLTISEGTNPPILRYDCAP